MLQHLSTATNRLFSVKFDVNCRIEAGKGESVANYRICVRRKVRVNQRTWQDFQMLFWMNCVPAPIWKRSYRNMFR